MRNWLVIADQLSGYTFDLFEAVERQGDVSVRFLYAPIDGAASFEHETTGPMGPGRLWWSEASWSRLRDFVRTPRPEVAFLYGVRPRIRQHLVLSMLPRDVRSYYVSDSNIHDLERSPALLPFRRLAHRYAAKRVTAALATGRTNALAHERLGFRRIVDLSVLSVDFGAFPSGLARARAAEREGSRARLLAIARLIPRKNILRTARAIAADPELRERIELVCAGSGPEQPELERLARTTPEFRLAVLGAVPREQIGVLIASADALLLPSSDEPWGIAVTEALGLGLPVIASPEVGAAVSLAEETRGVLLARSAAPADIVASIHEWLERRAELAANARAAAPWVRARYDRNEIARRMLAL